MINNLTKTLKKFSKTDRAHDYAYTIQPPSLTITSDFAIIVKLKILQEIARNPPVSVSWTHLINITISCANIFIKKNKTPHGGIDEDEIIESFFIRMHQITNLQDQRQQRAKRKVKAGKKSRDR